MSENKSPSLRAEIKKILSKNPKFEPESVLNTLKKEHPGGKFDKVKEKEVRVMVQKTKTQKLGAAGGGGGQGGTSHGDPRRTIAEGAQYIVANKTSPYPPDAGLDRDAVAKDDAIRIAHTNLFADIWVQRYSAEPIFTGKNEDLEPEKRMKRLAGYLNRFRPHVLCVTEAQLELLDYLAPEDPEDPRAIARAAASHGSQPADAGVSSTPLHAMQHQASPTDRTTESPLQPPSGARYYWRSELCRTSLCHTLTPATRGYGVILLYDPKRLSLRSEKTKRISHWNKKITKHGKDNKCDATDIAPQSSCGGNHEIEGVRWERIDGEVDLCQEAFDTLRDEEKHEYIRIAFNRSPPYGTAPPTLYDHTLLGQGYECTRICSDLNRQAKKEFAGLTESHPNATCTACTNSTSVASTAEQQGHAKSEAPTAFVGPRWRKWGCFDASTDLCQSCFDNLTEGKKHGYEVLLLPDAVPKPYGFDCVDYFQGAVEDCDDMALIATLSDKDNDMEFSVVTGKSYKGQFKSLVEACKAEESERPCILAGDLNRDTDKDVEQCGLKDPFPKDNLKKLKTNELVRNPDFYTYCVKDYNKLKRFDHLLLSEELVNASTRVWCPSRWEDVKFYRNKKVNGIKKVNGKETVNNIIRQFGTDHVPIGVELKMQPRGPTAEEQRPEPAREEPNQQAAEADGYDIGWVNLTLATIDGEQAEQAKKKNKKSKKVKEAVATDGGQAEEVKNTAATKGNCIEPEVPSP